MLHEHPLSLSPSFTSVDCRPFLDTVDTPHRKVHPNPTRGALNETIRAPVRPSCAPESSMDPGCPAEVRRSTPQLKRRFGLGDAEEQSVTSFTHQVGQLGLGKGFVVPCFVLLQEENHRRCGNPAISLHLTRCKSCALRVWEVHKISDTCCFIMLPCSPPPDSLKSRPVPTLSDAFRQDTGHPERSTSSSCTSSGWVHAFLPPKTPG